METLNGYQHSNRSSSPLLWISGVYSEGKASTLWKKNKHPCVNDHGSSRQGLRLLDVVNGKRVSFPSTASIIIQEVCAYMDVS